MIKFFRHIRQSMINQNRTKKYLLYAIGEIILVVIGILIAINLNNNNQIKIAEKEREDKINKLRNVVYGDSLHLVFTINYNKRNIKVLDSLIANLDANLSFQNYKQYSGQFARANMQYRTTIPDMSVYSELINSGDYSKIDNSDLKDNITDYYVLFNHFNDLINTFISGLLISEKSLFYNGILSHYYLQPNLSEDDMMQGYMEFKTTLNDPTKRRIFKNHLFELKDMHQQIIFFYSEVVKRIEGIPIKPTAP
ncbi:DUF6090 family protein [Winogradskyella ouciana]|uniref:DUF6090 family protein n=1 Tax=Winogradskyella ouciana TaxID=2608631 RepID=UPI003D27E766